MLYVSYVAICMHSIYVKIFKALLVNSKIII